MKPNKFLLLIVLFSSIALMECKKGEDDPLLSLRSRKARVAGSWKMESGTSKSSSTTPSFPVNSDTYVYTQSSYQHTDVNNGLTTINSGSSSYTLKLEKDGKMTLVQVMDGEVFTANGTWNFTGKVGEVKNKEQIVLHFESATYPNLNYTFLGNTTNLTFNIKELRNKKMVISSSYTDTYSNGNVETYSQEYTLEQ